MGQKKTDYDKVSFTRDPFQLHPSFSPWSTLTFSEENQASVDNQRPDQYPLITCFSHSLQLQNDAHS